MSRNKIKYRNDISESITVRIDEDELNGLVNDAVLIGSSSIVGTRNNQQDCFFAEYIAEKNCSIAIVCDGMGGLADGAIASRTAVEYIADELRNSIGAEDMKALLLRITREANRRILSLETKSGTTVVVAVIKDSLLHWASVGDSKIYIFKDGMLSCLTNEHNYSFMAERRKRDINFKFNPNVRQDALVSYLGAEKPEYIDIYPLPIALSNGDTILLCSDGLYKALNEEQIVEKILDDSLNVDETATALTSEAIARSVGGQDNTTVVVMKYKNEKLFNKTEEEKR